MDSSLYFPGEKSLWSGRDDGPDTLRYHQAITVTSFNNAHTPSIGILGFACDAGIQRNQGRIGAREGPAAIRRELSNLPIHHANLSVYDFGDIKCSRDNLEQAQMALADIIYQLLVHDVTPVVLGGGHEVTWGHYQGLARRYEQEPITLINLDAHYDLRPLVDGKGNSGTSFQQIAEDCQKKKVPFDYCCIGIQELANTTALFKRASELNVKTVYARNCYEDYEAVIKKIDEIVAGSKNIYLTVCMDVFAMAFAPGVSAPQPLGLLPWDVVPMIQRIAASGKVRSFDIAELSPPHDVNNATAKLAAMLVATFIHATSA